jgi:hypothetical protein
MLSSRGIGHIRHAFCQIDHTLGESVNIHGPNPPIPSRNRQTQIPGRDRPKTRAHAHTEWGIVRLC